MDVELSIVHLHPGVQHTISHVKIGLKGLEDYYPLWKEIEANIQDMKDTLDPRNICLYWRANEKRFVPVYDYLTYKAMLMNLAEKRLYLVVRDRAAQDEERDVARMRARSAEGWPERCAAQLIAAEKHPSVSLCGRGADERLLQRLFPHHVRGVNLFGYAHEDAKPTKMVLDALQGNPTTGQQEEDGKEEGKKGKKKKDKKGKKGKKGKKSKKGKKGKKKKK